MRSTTTPSGGPAAFARVRASSPRPLVLAVAALVGFACPATEPEPANRIEAPVADAATDPATARPGRTLRKLDAEERQLVPIGRWRRLDTSLPAAGAPSDSAEDEAMTEQLLALGYVDGTQRVASRGVVLHDPKRSEPGLNLYSSGHGGEAYLVDMEGREQHRWSAAFVDIWPDRKIPPGQERRLWWRHVELLEGGALLAIFEGQGLIKLDVDSKVLWARDISSHHDLDVVEDGTLYTLTRTRRRIPRIHPELPVVEDFVTLLDADGRELRSISILEALEASDFAYVIGELERQHGDIFHTNSIEVLDGRLAALGPQWSAGNVLLSSRRLDAVFVLSPSEEKVVWLQRGTFAAQHDAQILENGHLLLFDNEGRPGESSIQEIDPASGEVRWEYRGSEGAPFFTAFLGAVQRLEGGNTLVTESESGRVFEVTPAGEIVWEFFTPHRAGTNHEFIATLSRMRRLPLDHMRSWKR